MVSVKQVNLSMFPQFYPLLKEINPQLTEAEWYNVFAHQWYPEEKFCGYGLFDVFQQLKRSPYWLGTVGRNVLVGVLFDIHYFRGSVEGVQQKGKLFL